MLQHLRNKMSNHNSSSSAPRRLPGFLRRSMRSDMMDGYDMSIDANTPNHTHDTIIRMEPAISSTSKSTPMRSPLSSAPSQSPSQVQSSSLSPSSSSSFSTPSHARSTLTSLIPSPSIQKRREEEEEEKDQITDAKNNMDTKIDTDGMEDVNQIDRKFRFMKSPSTNLSPSPSMEAKGNDKTIGSTEYMDSSDASDAADVNSSTATAVEQMTGQKYQNDVYEYGTQERNYDGTKSNYKVENDYNNNNNNKNGTHKFKGTSNNAKTPTRRSSSFSSSTNEIEINPTNSHEEAQMVHVSNSNASATSPSSFRTTSRSRTFTNDDQDELNTSASSANVSIGTNVTSSSTSATQPVKSNTTASAATNTTHTNTSANSTPSKPSKRRSMNYKETEFEKTITEPVVNIAALRKLGWNGIPVSVTCYSRYQIFIHRNLHTILNPCSFIFIIFHFLVFILCGYPYMKSYFM